MVAASASAAFSTASFFRSCIWATLIRMASWFTSIRPELKTFWLNASSKEATVLEDMTLRYLAIRFKASVHARCNALDFELAPSLSSAAAFSPPAAPSP